MVVMEHIGWKLGWLFGGLVLAILIFVISHDSYFQITGGDTRRIPGSTDSGKPAAFVSVYKNQKKAQVIYFGVICATVYATYVIVSLVAKKMGATEASVH